ncbi:MAG: UbiA family prenyltransferase, partial [Pedococcus sp.]
MGEHTSGRGAGPVTRPTARTQVGALVAAAHPAPAAAVTVLTALLAVAAGHSLGSGTLVVAAVATGQLSIGWSNDLIDAGRDRRVGRTDKPVATGAVAAPIVRVATALSLVACVALSLACGWQAGLVHLGLGVASGWAYNLGLKRTVWSAVPYAVAFGALTAVVSLALPDPAW